MKYMFGVMGVYGKEPKLYVRGVWMWRGEDETPLELKSHPSFEFYTKTRLDVTKPEQKALVMEYWTNGQWEETEEDDDGNVTVT